MWFSHCLGRKEPQILWISEFSGVSRPRFAKGELDEATSCWMQALESLPPTRKGLLGLLEAPKPEDASKILAETLVSSSVEAVLGLKHVKTC